MASPGLSKFNRPGISSRALEQEARRALLPVMGLGTGGWCCGLVTILCWGHMIWGQWGRPHCGWVETGEGARGRGRGQTRCLCWTHK